MYHRCESGGERGTLISILVFIVPDSTMMLVHLSVNVMLMDGYKHHRHSHILTLPLLELHIY
jgi:hypothetical protein